jgi:hypothetical protein
MISKNGDSLSRGVQARRWVYGIILAAMAFTGFGQMPVYKRYYVSALPGMGWSADYYFTLAIHYVGAALLLAFLGYVIGDFLLKGKKAFRVTASGYGRMALLAGLVLTGVFRVLKNLPDVDFSAGLTMLVDISHLVFMMGYGATALVFWRMKARWMVPIKVSRSSEKLD